MKERFTRWLEGMVEPLRKFRIWDFVPAAVFLAIFLTVFTNVRVDSASMLTTLHVDDRALCLNMWSFYSPKRGDIVCFDMNDDVFIKRVIGLPGETVTFKDGYVYINGDQLDEPYLAMQGITFPIRDDTFVVPDDSVFLLGDNRLNSSDSRYWPDPYIKIKVIKCKYLFTYFHSNF